MNARLTEEARKHLTATLELHRDAVDSAENALVTAAGGLDYWMAEAVFKGMTAEEVAEVSGVDFDDVEQAVARRRKAMVESL